jgi:hypothetical protein
MVGIKVYGWGRLRPRETGTMALNPWWLASRFIYKELYSNELLDLMVRHKFVQLILRKDTQSQSFSNFQVSPCFFRVLD